MCGRSFSGLPKHCTVLYMNKNPYFRSPVCFCLKSHIVVVYSYDERLYICSICVNKQVSSIFRIFRRFICSFQRLMRSTFLRFSSLMTRTNTRSICDKIKRYLSEFEDVRGEYIECSVDPCLFISQFCSEQLCVVGANGRNMLFLNLQANYL